MEIAAEGIVYAAEALSQSIRRQAFGMVRPFEVV
jgi:hypothetical protein